MSLITTLLDALAAPAAVEALDREIADLEGRLARKEAPVKARGRPQSCPQQPLTDAQQRLVEENLRLAYWLAHRQPRPAYVSPDDWEAEALAALCRAAASYDPARGGFATYVWRPIRWALLQLARQYQRSGAALEHDPMWRSAGPEEEASRRDEHEWASQVLARAKERMSKRQARALDLWLAGTSMAEVARRFGVGHVRGQQLVARALAWARKEAMGE